MEGNYYRYQTIDLDAFNAILESYRSDESQIRHFHLKTPDEQYSFVLIVPIVLSANNGIAHVLEHILLAANESTTYEHKFFALQGESDAVSMNATTCSRYMALHVTADDLTTLQNQARDFVHLFSQPRFSEHQFAIETGTQETKVDTDQSPRMQQGVVVNEMHGHFSDPLATLQNLALRMLYQSGPKSFHAGGYPEEIEALTLDDLKTFWGACFRLEQACVITQGDFSADMIHDLLKNLEPRRSSDPLTIEQHSPPVVQPQCVDIQTDQQQAALTTLALLLVTANGETERIEVMLLDVLLTICHDAIREKYAELDFNIVQMPRIVEHEDDLILLTVMEPGNKASDDSGDDFVSLLVDALSMAITRMDSEMRTAMLDGVIADYLTVGHSKFSAGVDLSLRLWEHLSRHNEYPGAFGQTEALSRFSDVMQSSTSWQAIVHKHLLSHSRRVLIHSTPVESDDGESSEEYSTINGPPYCASQAVPVPGEYLANAHAVFESAKQHDKQLPEFCVERYHVNGSAIACVRAPTMNSSRLHVTAPYSFEARQILQLSLPELHLIAPTLRLNLLTGLSPEGMYSAYFDLKLDLYKRDAMEVASRITDLLTAAEDILDRTESQREIKLPAPPLHVGLMAWAAKSYSESANAVYESTTIGCKGVSVETPSVSLRNTTDESRIPVSVCFIGDQSPPEDALANLASCLSTDIRYANASDFLPPGEGETENIRIINGAVSHACRVWALPPSFGTSPEHDAALHILAALVTTIYLEPMIRHNAGAYAAAAEVRTDIGVLGMFSFRDPTPALSHDVFQWAIPQTLAGNFDLREIERAKCRAAGRIKPRGSVADRCHRRYSLWLLGRPDGYNLMLQNQIREMTTPRFFELVAKILPTMTPGWATFAGANYP